MPDEVEGGKTTELLLSVRIEQLQKQLQEVNIKIQKLRECVEIMLMQALKPLDIVHIRKPMVSPKSGMGIF